MSWRDPSEIAALGGLRQASGMEPSRHRILLFFAWDLLGMRILPEAAPEARLRLVPGTVPQVNAASSESLPTRVQEKQRFPAACALPCTAFSCERAASEISPPLRLQWEWSSAEDATWKHQ